MRDSDEVWRGVLSTVALTLDVYSHVLPQADQEAAERIADLLPTP